MSEKIKDILESGEDIVFKHIGKLDSESVKDVFYSASRISSEAILVDIDVFPGKEIVSALQSFRISRPNTRVIIIAPERKPGDEIISSIVGLGIYDIVAEVKDLDWNEIINNVLLSTPATYSQAARWHTGQFVSDGGRNRERVVIEERPSGVIVIAVAGAAHGLGCTHTAFSLASFLSRSGYSVAVIEDNQRPAFSYFINVLKAKEGKVKDSHVIHGIDIFALNESKDRGDWNFDTLVKEIKAGQYEYVIRDLGVLDSSRIREMYRADEAFIVASAAKWRWNECMDKLDNEFSIIFPLASNSDVDEFSFYTYIKGTAFPYCPNPFSKDNDSVILKLLDPVLPNRRKKRALFEKLLI
jgi:hypothetical protein